MDIFANLISNVASAGDSLTTAPSFALSTDSGAPAGLFSVALDSAELKLVNSPRFDSVPADGPVDIKRATTELVETKLVSAGLIDIEPANAKSESTSVKEFTVPANRKTSDPESSDESAPVFEKDTPAVERVVVQNASQTNSIFDCHGNIPDCHGYPKETDDEVVPTDTRTNTDEVDGSAAPVVTSPENADVVVDDIVVDATVVDDVTADIVVVDDIAIRDVAIDDVTFDESLAIDQPKLAPSPFDQPRIDLPRIDLPEHDESRRVDDNLATESFVRRGYADARIPVEAVAVDNDFPLFDRVADEAAEGSTAAQPTPTTLSSIPTPFFSIEKQAVASKPDANERIDPAVVSGIHHERPPGTKGLDQLTDLLIRSSAAPSAPVSLNTAELPTISIAIPRPELTDAVQADHRNTPAIRGDSSDGIEIPTAAVPRTVISFESSPARSVQLPLAAPGQSKAINSGRTVSLKIPEIELTVQRNPRSPILRENVPVAETNSATIPERHPVHPHVVRQASTPSRVDSPGVADTGPTQAGNSTANDYGTATPHMRSNQAAASVTIPEIHPESQRVEYRSPEIATAPETEPATEAQPNPLERENKRFFPVNAESNVPAPVQRTPAHTSRYGNSLSTSDETLQVDSTKPGTTESGQAPVAGEEPHAPQPPDSNLKSSMRMAAETFEASPIQMSTPSEATVNHFTVDLTPGSSVGSTQSNPASSLESPAPAARPGIPQQLLATIENSMDGDGLSTVTQNETVELRMKLNPVDLGEVVLLLNQSADSRTASILVGDKVVQQLVESGMEQLETNLRELGFDSVEVDVFSRDARDQRFEHAQQDRPPKESQEDQPNSPNAKPGEPPSDSPDDQPKQQGINIVA